MKRIISLLLLMAITLSAFSFSAFAAEDNATGGDGEAGRAKATSSYYRGDECMWKVTLYVGKSDTVDKNSSLVNDFYKLGSAYIRHDVYEMYEPFYFGNGCKADYLQQPLFKTLRKGDIVLITDNTMPYPPVLNKYTDPATGKKINKSSIEDVKAYFGRYETILTILDGIAQKQGTTAANLIKSKSFTIGDTTKMGWMSAQIIPKETAGESKQFVPWVIVYEPVTVLHVREGSSEVKENLAFTATEFTLAEMTNFRKLDGAGESVAYQLSPNSVQLENSWFGYPVYPIRGSEESWTPTQVLFGGGWGMRYLEPAAKAPTKDVDLSAEFIEPNAPYHKGVTVISTVKVTNASEYNVVPKDNCVVEFTATYTKNGKETVIDKQSKIVIDPANEKNIVWFKWTIPDGIPADQVSLKAVVNATDTVPESNKSNNTARLNEKVFAIEYSQTPDTKYERETPKTFKKPSNPSSTVAQAKWTVWEYKNDSFEKVTYAIGIANTSVKLTPDPDVKSTTKNAKGDTVMKSGYAFSLNLTPQYAIYSSSGYLFPKSEDYTPIQAAYALFPEFGYRHTLNEYRTLEKVGNAFQFVVNPYTDGKERFHFTPLWYPDGEYRVTGVLTEFWTPVGMLQRQSVSDPIIISGNAYDDWYLHH